MIKLLVMDVDGTLTDGHIYMSAQGEAMKAFDVKDGYAIAHMLPQLGIEPVILTGRRSRIVERRAEELGIRRLYQGVSDKAARLEALFLEADAAPEETAYIGDDLNDLPCIHMCGVTACPADAAEAVRTQVSYICHAAGGRGAVREFIEFLASRAREKK